MRKVKSSTLFLATASISAVGAACLFYGAMVGWIGTGVSDLALVSFVAAVSLIASGFSAYAFIEERREAAGRARQAPQQEEAIELAQVVGHEAHQQEQANQPPAYAIDAPANGVDLQGYNVLNQPPSYSDYLEDGAPMRPADMRLAETALQDPPPSYDSIVALQNQDPRSQAYLEQGSHRCLKILGRKHIWTKKLDRQIKVLVLGASIFNITQLRFKVHLKIMLYCRMLRRRRMWIRVLLAQLLVRAFFQIQIVLML